MARLGNKDRGLYEREKGSGVWHVDFYDHRGRRRRKKIGTKKAALAYYHAQKQKVEQVRENPELEPKFFGSIAKGITLREFLTILKPEFERQRSARDQLRHAKTWERLVGHKPLEQISREHAVRRQQALLDKGLKPSSINRETAFLRMVLHKAVERELLEKNPLSRFKLLPENNKRDRFLSYEEERFLEAHMKPEDFELVAVAVDTGLRRGELFSLSWSAVRFDDGGWVRITKTKSNEARSVPLTERALGILRRRYQSRKSHFVFPNQKGDKPMQAANFVRRRYKPALKAMGVTDLTWHSLRHTCGSRLALEGKSLQQIGQILGHSQVETTKRYSHLLPETARATISALDEANRRKSDLRLVR